MDGTDNAASSPGGGLQTGIAPHRGANFAAVSFDVDGTLYADGFLRARIALEAVRRLNPRFLRDLYRFDKRAAAARAAGGALDRSWASTIPTRLEAEARLLLPVIRRLGPRAGAADLLTRLRPRTLIAVSDFDAEAKLEALGLRHHFDHTYAAERYGALKPDPLVFRAALADLGIAPSTLLHVGDRPDTDGLAARAAGCRALILGTDFASFRGLGNLLAP